MTLSRRFRAPRWGYDMERSILAAIKHSKEEIMSELDDRISQLEQNVNDVGSAIQTEIQQVRDAIAAGTVTADDLNRLDQLSQKLTGDITDLQADDPAAPPA